MLWGLRAQRGCGGQAALGLALGLRLRQGYGLNPTHARKGCVLGNHKNSSVRVCMRADE